MSTHMEHVEQKALDELDRLIKRSPAFRRLEERVNQLMGAVDDIKTSIGKLGQDVQRVSSDLAALAAKIPAAGSGETVSEDDLATIKSGIDAAAASLETTAQTVESILNPTPAGGDTSGG